MNSKTRGATLLILMILALGLVAMPRASEAGGDPDIPDHGIFAYVFNVELSVGGVRYRPLLAILKHFQ